MNKFFKHKDIQNTAKQAVRFHAPMFSSFVGTYSIWCGQEKK